MIRFARKLMAGVALVGCALTVACTALDSEPVFSPAGTQTRIFIVRHAERDPGLDPPLNEEGMARAQALARELSGEGVTAVFYPDLIRNRQTADPLVEATGAVRREFNAVEAADTRALANTIVTEVLRDHAGGVVVWIGNTGPAIEGVQSGNLQELYARLGGTGIAPIRYRNLYRVDLSDRMPPEIIKGVYGGSSSLD